MDIQEKNIYNILYYPWFQESYRGLGTYLLWVRVGGYCASSTPLGLSCLTYKAGRTMILHLEGRVPDLKES